MIALECAALEDEEIVERVRHGETALYEVIMRRYNQRLYRIARSILRDDSEAEDVMQEAYVRAYQHLDQFAGEARFATWLTKIAVYEALARSRRRGRWHGAEPAGPDTLLEALESTQPDPEQQAAGREIKALLEDAVLRLPEAFRTVYVLREVEELNTAETARCLGILEETVKTRLHRARALLRRELYRQAGLQAGQLFGFHLSRCDRVVEGVMARIGS